MAGSKRCGQDAEPSTRSGKKGIADGTIVDNGTADDADCGVGKRDRQAELQAPRLQHTQVRQANGAQGAQKDIAAMAEGRQAVCRVAGTHRELRDAWLAKSRLHRQHGQRLLWPVSVRLPLLVGSRRHDTVRAPGGTHRAGLQSGSLAAYGRARRLASLRLKNVNHKN